MTIVAHSGATSGHSAMCDVRNVPSAAVSVTRQRSTPMMLV